MASLLYISFACLVQAVCDPASILLLAHFSALSAESDTPIALLRAINVTDSALSGVHTLRTILCNRRSSPLRSVTRKQVASLGGHYSNCLAIKTQTPRCMLNFPLHWSIERRFFTSSFPRPELHCLPRLCRREEQRHFCCTKRLLLSCMILSPHMLLHKEGLLSCHTSLSPLGGLRTCRAASAISVHHQI